MLQDLEVIKMARTISEGVREGLATMSALQQQRQQRSQMQLQNQVMIADLAEKGYDYTPGQDGFLGTQLGAKQPQLRPNGNIGLARQLQQAKLAQLLNPKYEPKTFDEAKALKEAGRSQINFGDMNPLITPEKARLREDLDEKLARLEAELQSLGGM